MYNVSVKERGFINHIEMPIHACTCVLNSYYRIFGVVIHSFAISSACYHKVCI